MENLLEIPTRIPLECSQEELILRELWMEAGTKKGTQYNPLTPHPHLIHHCKVTLNQSSKVRKDRTVAKSVS